MLKLYQFHPCWELPNASPFCMKLETYLKMAKIPYDTIDVMNPSKAPKGKLPFIEDDGRTIADSGLIIDYLKDKYDNSLDDHLSVEQAAQAVAFTRLIEEHLYWVIVYSRWIDESGWAKTADTYFASIPRPMRNIVANSVRKNTKKQLYDQGLGRHSNEQIYGLGKDDLAAICDFLDTKEFFFGDKPSSIDATLYAFLANIIYVPIESPLKEYAMSLDNLVKYCHRMEGRFY